MTPASMPKNNRYRANIYLALATLCLALSSCGESDRPKNTSPGPKTGLGVVRLTGSPEEIGRQHGAQLTDSIRIMVSEYLKRDVQSGQLDATMLARIHRMKSSLPDWYRKELAACAEAAGVDEDVLLFAQCEGDIRTAGGCTTYVALGAATHDGSMEIGRNFDYWGLESTDACAGVLVIVPNRSDGYAFLAVGWSGILGGWTLINEKGLFVANNLGGFREKNPKGVPTLILARIIAQKAANLDEAIKIVQETPRMRGQALVIGYVGDSQAGIQADAAVVEYDAVTVKVSRPADGLAFHTSVGTNRQKIQQLLKRARHKPTDVIKSAGGLITLHSVAIRPQDGVLWVAHGRKSSAHLGEYVRYDIKSLLKRED